MLYITKGVMTMLNNNTMYKKAEKKVMRQSLVLFIISMVTIALSVSVIWLHDNYVIHALAALFAITTIPYIFFLIGYVSLVTKDGKKTEEMPAEESSVKHDMPDVMEETIVIASGVNEEMLAEAICAPSAELETIDFIDETDDTVENGIDVISVVWPERAHKNKIYRYKTNGHNFSIGDFVLVPTWDAARKKEVIRKATVAHHNHKIDPDYLKHPLKEIIGIIRRKEETAL